MLPLLAEASLSDPPDAGEDGAALLLSSSSLLLPPPPKPSALKPATALYPPGKAPLAWVAGGAMEKAGPPAPVCKCAAPVASWLAAAARERLMRRHHSFRSTPAGQGVDLQVVKLLGCDIFANVSQMIPQVW